MSSIAGLWKPEYLLQPRRLARRILGRTRAADERGMFVVPLPWVHVERIGDRHSGVACSAERCFNASLSAVQRRGGKRSGPRQAMEKGSAC